MNPSGGRRKTAASLMLLLLFSLSTVAVLSLSPVAHSYGPPNSQFDCSATSPFGTGSSGNVTISTATTLSANMSYGNLTVDSGITLNTGGYSIDVCGTLHVIGAISYTGSAGSSGSTGSAGTNGGAGDGVSCTASSSSAGGNAATNAGGGGGACSTGSSTDATGGAGGSPGGNGGTGHTGASPVLVVKPYIIDNAGSVTLTGGAGGPGGAGGAGGNGAAGSVSGGLVGGGGGGGGGDGGKGGNGGNGGSGTLTIDYGLTSGSGLGTVTAPGGAAGAGQSGGSGGSGGSGVSTTSGICTSVSGGSGSDGSAGGGVTGSGSDCTASNGAAGTAGASGTNGAAGAAGTITETDLLVTQPILVATPTGGSPFTYTVSGCSVFPTSATSGSTATDFTASPSCLLTVTMPAAGTSTRYVFASSASSTTVTTCSTGTCTTFSPSDYYQLQNTFKAAYPDGSPTGGAPAWCTQAGVDTSLGQLTTSGLTPWCDYGSIAYAQGYVSDATDATATQQYSAVPLTQGASLIMPFQGQPSSCASFPDLSHNNNTGTAGGSPTCGADYVSLNSANPDYVSIPNSASLDPTTALTVSVNFTVSESGSISSASAVFGQYSGAIEVDAYLLGSSSPYALHVEVDDSAPGDLNCVVGNVATNTNHVVTLTYSATSGLIGYLDGVQGCSKSGSGDLTNKQNVVIGCFSAGSNCLSEKVYSFGYWLSVLTPSEVSELHASTFATVEHQITSPSNTYTFDYYHQYAEAPYYTAISATPSGNALNYYYSSLGQSLTDTMGTSSATIWADATTVTVGDHYVSSGERYSSNANTTLSAADTSGPDVSVYHQYAATSSYSGTVATGGAPSLACQRYGSPSSDALTTTASVKWVDSGCAFSITKPSADFPSTGTRYETNYANGTISAATTIDPAFYQQFYVTPGTGINKLTGTEFGGGVTYTIPGWLDSGTSVTSDGTASCAFTVSGPSWDYQFGGSTLQAWLNTTGSSFGDYTSSSPPYVTFDAAHVSATVCVPSSSGLSVTGVTDDGSPVAYSWVSPLVTFKGDSVFEVQLSGSGSSSPSGSPPSSGSPSGSSPLPPPSTVVSAAPDYLGYGLVLIAAIIVGVLALQRFEQGPLYSVARKKGKGLARGVKRRRTLRLGRKED